MEHLIVGKGSTIKYGASKSNAAVNTAVSPADLADGSVGIFGLCNDGKTRLITSVASDTGAKAYVTTFTAGTDSTYGGKKFFWAVGTTDGCLTTNPVEYKASKDSIATRGVENVLPLRQLSYVGYNPVDAVGTLNLPTVVVGDSISLGVQFTYPVESIYNVKNYDAGLLTTDSAYEQLRKLVAAINSNTTGILQADIVGAAGTAGVAMAAGTGIVVTKGSTTITGTGMTVLTAGQYLKIANNQPLSGVSTNINTPLNTAGTALTPSAANTVIYKIVSANGTTIVLDRPYTGETKTGLGFASFLTESVLSTSLGIRLIGITNPNIAAYPKYPNFSFNLTGLENLADATIYDRPASGVTGFRGVTSGSGTTNQLLDLEKRAIVFSGGQSLFGDATLQWAKGFTSRVDTSCNTYDMYFTTFVPDIQLSSTVGSATKGEPILLAAAFPSGAYSAGDNQYDYDVLIKLLGQYSGNADAATA